MSVLICCMALGTSVALRPLPTPSGWGRCPGGAAVRCARMCANYDWLARARARRFHAHACLPLLSSEPAWQRSRLRTAR